MPDGTTKILLSSKGKMDDVATDMKAFLEYVDGKMVEDAFVQEIQEIDQEIKNIKAQEQERVSYMTYAMKIQEERDEARAEGMESAILASIRNFNEKHEVIRTASNGCVGNSNYGTSEICGIALNRKNEHRGRKIPPTMPVFHEFGTILHWRKKQG